MTSSSLVLLVMVLLFYSCHYCNGIDSEYYPIYGTDTSFELNLQEDVTYGSGKPSVTALDENIFAVTWASSSNTKTIEYNENIYCRLFLINQTSKTEPAKLIYPTIQVNKITDRHQYNPQIVALSDHDNVISDNKQFAIVWHSNDLDGNFDGIYLKIYKWDKQEEIEENKITIIIEDEDKEKIETKITDDTHSIIGNAQITPIFDTSKFIISWISRTVNQHIFTYDVCQII